MAGDGIGPGRVGGRRGCQLLPDRGGLGETRFPNRRRMLSGILQSSRHWAGRHAKSDNALMQTSPGIASRCAATPLILTVLFGTNSPKPRRSVCLCWVGVQRHYAGATTLTSLGVGLRSSATTWSTQNAYSEKERCVDRQRDSRSAAGQPDR